VNRKTFQVVSGEMIFALIITAMGILWAISGLQTGVWFDDAPSGGFMLVFIGVFLTLLGAASFWSGFKSSVKNQDHSSQMTRKDRRIVLMIFAIALIGLVLMNYLLGTMLVLTLFLVGWFKLYVHFDWKKTILFTVCIMTVIYAVFVLLLNVRFPTFLGLGFI